MYAYVKQRSCTDGTPQEKMATAKKNKNKKRSMNVRMAEQSVDSRRIADKRVVNALTHARIRLERSRAVITMELVLP